ncbi:MAG: HD-like signal output (HDOD) protein [Planctomycetota bacterium]|jgi:HD-like signal output (HDOD) protein
MEALIDRLKKLESLPSHPGVLAELSIALGRDDVSASEIESIVSLDTALVGSAIKRANSAAFAGMVHVESLKDAVTRLGNQGLLAVAAAQNTKGPLDDAGRAYGLPPGGMWYGARAGALVAASIAQNTGLASPSVCFTGGLLRDCGKVAMDFLFTDGEIESMLANRERSTDVIKLEHETFGLDHAEVGEQLALGWGLSADLATAIRLHHTPSEGEETNIVADIVHCADALCAMLGLGVGVDGLSYTLDLGARDRVGIGMAEMHIYLAELTGHIKELGPIPHLSGSELK